jgi:hypothetical protein
MRWPARSRLRGRDVVERAGTHVGTEGSGEEQDEPDGDSSPEGSHGSRPEREPGHFSAFEDSEQPFDADTGSHPTISCISGR